MVNVAARWLGGNSLRRPDLLLSGTVGFACLPPELEAYLAGLLTSQIDLVAFEPRFRQA